MGRKKKKVLRPWCWYCNREFDEVKVLIQHQQAKHFKCSHCNKKLMSGPGLTIHALQVHKEKIDRIPGSLPGRNNPTLEIYGMDGIPEGDAWAHEQEKLGGNGEPPSKMPAMAPPMPSYPPGMVPPSSFNAPSILPFGQPPSDIPASWTQQPQGYPPQPQGYAMPPQGYPPQPQGYPPQPQGYPPQPQGYPSQAPPMPSNTAIPMPPTAFPAYTASTTVAPVLNEVQVQSAKLMKTATGEIKHIDADLSLEERRASFQRYSHKHNFMAHATMAAPATLYTHPPVYPQGANFAAMAHRY